MSEIDIEGINSEIREGKITLRQCKKAVEELPCYRSGVENIRPSYPVIGSQNLCSSARLQAGVAALPYTFLAIQSFPSRSYMSGIPEDCAECPVFVPALALLLKTYLANNV